MLLPLAPRSLTTPTPTPLGLSGTLLLEGLLRPSAIAPLVEFAAQVGYAPATVRGMGMRPEIRNNERLIVDDRAAADVLFDAIEPYLPTLLGHDEAVACNERFRFYRYHPGMRFKRHRDGVEARDGLQSQATLLLYCQVAAEGGETVFHDRVAGSTAQRRVVAARAGDALLFRHALWHESKPVVHGEKVVLRTDILCLPQS